MSDQTAKISELQGEAASLRHQVQSSEEKCGQLEDELQLKVQDNDRLQSEAKVAKDTLASGVAEVKQQAAGQAEAVRLHTVHAHLGTSNAGIIMLSSRQASCQRQL